MVAPNLTKLAESGVNFQRAYTAAPVCSPSRTAFFSGVAPWKSGHYHNTPGASTSEPLNNALSLAGFFKRAGYTTASYGKITHGWDQREHWDERIGHKRDPAPPGAPLTRAGRGEQDWGPIHLAEGEMPRRADTIRPEAAERYSSVHRYLLDHGIYLAPSAYEVAFLSTAHDLQHIESLARTLLAAIRELAA